MKIVRVKYFDHLMFNGISEDRVLGAKPTINTVIGLIADENESFIRLITGISDYGDKREVDGCCIVKSCIIERIELREEKKRHE